MSAELRSLDNGIAIKQRWFAVGRTLYGLPDDEIERAYEVAKASGIVLDDALGITLFVGARIGRTVDDLVRLSTTLPPMLDEAGRNAAGAIRSAAKVATGKVVEAAVAQVEARHAEMSEAVGAQIASVARDMMREQLAAGQVRRAGLLASAVCIAVLLGLGVGYHLGSGYQATVTNQIAAYAARPDAAAWIRLMAANPDLDQRLAAYCNPRSSNFQRLASGVPTCNLPIYLEGPPLPTANVEGTGWMTRLEVTFERLPWLTTMFLGALLLAGIQWLNKKINGKARV